MYYDGVVVDDDENYKSLVGVMRASDGDEEEYVWIVIHPHKTK